MGDWSTTITLSIFSHPAILSCAPGFSLELYSFLARPRYKISSISVDLPEPETPVTQIKQPKGNFTSIFFKLCSLAPFISKKYLPKRHCLRVGGICIFNSLLKYCAVRETLLFIKSFK